MSEYICNDCGERFDEPSTYKERLPYGDTEVEEVWTICPECGSSDYATFTPCPNCNESAQEEVGLCNECQKHADYKLVCFWAALSEQERSYLDLHLLGGWLSDAVKLILESEKKQIKEDTHGN